MYLVQSKRYFFIRSEDLNFLAYSLIFPHDWLYIENNFGISIENQENRFICSYADILLLCNNFLLKIQFIPILSCNTTLFFCLIPMTIFTKSIKILKIAKIHTNNVSS